MSDFTRRHIGISESDTQAMLKTIGVSSLEELISLTVPSDIRLKEFSVVGKPLNEAEYLEHIRALGKKNKVLKSLIGLGYYNTHTPSVIHRNIFCNPGWYTAYTPYQAEIAQGRLEALLNYQTMVSDLTALPVANASLLDESTAAAEAVTMMYSNRSREQQKNDVHKVFISRHLFPQVKEVIYSRSEPLGIEVVEGDEFQHSLDQSFFGLVIQYPDVKGSVKDYRALVSACKEKGIQVAVGTDLLALCLLTPPGEWGADIAYGNSQRFGVPLGYGGPHAAFFAAKDEYKRSMPGRIIGVSIDSRGKKAYRMALQTREQHIKREKATSNICTAQALLAIMAGMYAVWHGPEGLMEIAENVHGHAVKLKEMLSSHGIKVLDNGLYFDTIQVECNSAEILKKAENAGYNFYQFNEKTINISLDETVTEQDIHNIASVFIDIKLNPNNGVTNIIHGTSFERKSAFLTHPVFHAHRSETEMMRYIKSLENKDLSLVHSMISLGSCTMKLNAAVEMEPLSMPEWAQIHPFVPEHQVQGYKELIENLNRYLSSITGFKRMSFQPNSGASGEYAGLLVIRAYHHHRGDKQRNVALIPSSAHGTNPASAAMAGMDIVVVKCDDNGNIDVNDLKAKAEQYKDRLACLMVTYPSTHGVFEESICDITRIIHENGGLVYMDGANMNAQVGITSPGSIGADVCHLNLHKTFAIPHGGGGPGMGPIGVNEKLEPFLPNHLFAKTGGSKGIRGISSAPYGSALILLISYGYIRLLGDEGLRKSTEYAILNANYLKALLEPHYKILYTGKNGYCAHEFILDCSTFKQESNVEVADIAKRLMDYGFHAPTVAFPVVNTLMIEPTESENKKELDRFAQALIQIRKEIQEIIDGKMPKDNNPLKNAPHTADMVISNAYAFPYDRETAAYPLSWVKENKFWPSCGRIDNAYGDRNLICTCPPVSEYIQ